MNNMDLVQGTIGVERAICRVTRLTKTKRKTVTGWLCSEDGWVITAGHNFIEDGEVYSEGTDTTTDYIFVEFPEQDQIEAHLVYAEKRIPEGIDFAVLCLTSPPLKIQPFCVNLDRTYWSGEVRIVGYGALFQDIAKAAIGYVESSMVNIVHGNDSFLHISSEKAAQKGYSGAPVYSDSASAVIAIQVMASESDGCSSAVESGAVNAMTVRKMIERFPELKRHLIILNRAFSGFDILKAVGEYKVYGNANNQYFNDKTIVDAILPTVERQETGQARMQSFNQPILDAIDEAHGRNCFVLGEEGGSGKTMILLKLFSTALRKNTIREIPIYIELRNLQKKSQQYNGYDIPGMLFAEHLSLKLFDSYFVKHETNISRNELGDKIRLELMEPSCCGTEYVFLLDGLNEVSIGRRSEICEEILFWAKYSHIRIIVTSRFKESLLVESSGISIGSLEEFLMRSRQLEDDISIENDKSFMLLTIQKLEEKVISDYLVTNGIQKNIIRQVMNNKELLKILRIPMYLTIFAKLYCIKLESQNSTNGNTLTSICTRGILLNEFFGEKEVQITHSVDIQEEKLGKSESSEIRKKKFVLDKIIPYIAFHIIINQNYGVMENELVDLIDNLFKDNRSIMRKREKYDWEYKTINELYNEQNNYDVRFSPAETIIRFIVEELHVMRKIQVNREFENEEVIEECCGENTYEFLHENLRDYFAARQMKEDIRWFVFFGKEGYSLAQRNIPRTVLEFLGDICREDESRPYYEKENKQWKGGHMSYLYTVLRSLQNRTDEDARVMISNIIAVMQYSRKNDLSGLDLRNIDFSETWLGGTRFSQAYGDTYFATKFDGATINASNLLRNGHDMIVTCVRRDRNNSNIIYSSDESGCIMQWNCEKGTCFELCRINEYIRDMVLSIDNNAIYIAVEHTIYQLTLMDRTISELYTTKAFISQLKIFDRGICFKTDINPVLWIELIIGENNQVLQVIGNEYAVAYWLAGHSCENRDGTYLIAGGSSRAHRVQVFHKNQDDDWNRIPVQTIELCNGNHMNWIEMSEDESRILFCVQNYLYEYSLVNGILDVELFCMRTKSELRFASYLYDEMDKYTGILYADGREIIFLDKNYKVNMHLKGGNGICNFANPFLVDCDYKFSRHDGMHRGVKEKYHLFMESEIQEFDADTNICNRVFKVGKLTKLGYCLKDQKVRLFFQNLYSIDLQNCQIEDTRGEDIEFIDYVEMKNFVSFSVQRLGQQVIVYDRYTDEVDTFKVYRGLLIQGCSMKNIKGDMCKPEYQEVLKRYGAILEEK